VARVSSYNDRSVLGEGGRTLGRVSAVLFHATESRVVGVEIDPGAVLGVVDRKPSYVLLGDLGLGEDRTTFTVPWARLPKPTASERALGFSWDESVIWQRMPVRSAAGDEVGTVHDVEFDPTTGGLTLLRVSTGAVGDAAVGRLEVPAELVRGFDGDAVIVLPEYAEIESTGGAAKAVASGVAAVKVRGGQVAEGALEVGVAASKALGRSIRGGMLRKALEKAKSLMDEDG
jgi:sporulation protein YlmC with PRC-barrel domain